VACEGSALQPTVGAPAAQVPEALRSQRRVVEYGANEEERSHSTGRVDCRAEARFFGSGYCTGVTYILLRG
jgi:hypothetical protein